MSVPYANYLTTSNDLTTSSNISNYCLDNVVITAPKGIYLPSSILWGNPNTSLQFNSTAGFFFNKSDGSTLLCKIDSGGIFTCNGLNITTSINSALMCSTIGSVDKDTTCSKNIWGNTLSLASNRTINANTMSYTGIFCASTLSMSGEISINTIITIPVYTSTGWCGLGITSGTTFIGPTTGSVNTKFSLEICDGARDYTKYGAMQITRAYNINYDTGCHISFVRATSYYWQFGIKSDNSFGIYNATPNSSSTPALRIQNIDNLYFYFTTGHTYRIACVDAVTMWYNADKLWLEHEFRRSTDNDLRLILTGSSVKFYKPLVIGGRMKINGLPDWGGPLYIPRTTYDGTNRWCFYYYYSSRGWVNEWQIPANVSIYVPNGIMLFELFIYSDRRIKTNIIDIDDNYALDTLRLLKPKKFNYIDVFHNKSDAVWGFIAQEVSEVLPYAVTTTTEKIPNIFDLAEVSFELESSADDSGIGTNNGSIITLLSKSTTLFEKDSSGNFFKISLLDSKRCNITTTITKIIDDKTFIIQDKLTIEQTSTPQNSNLSRIFVYGSIVDDFHALQKNAIYTIATAALQELDRNYQVTKLQVDKLKAVANDLKGKNISLQNYINEISAKINLILSR